MIKLTNVNKKYDTRDVLKSISHQFINKGICVIYGPSGSGKTTLLNCIAGLIDFNGSIQVDRYHIENLNDNDLSELRLSTFGFIFQDFKLFETETVLANLLFPLETLFNMHKPKKLRKCKDLLALVGLMDKDKQIVNKLSGGEKQRVAIARALINDPKIILADEPTGALDEQNGVEIMNIIKKISKKSLVIMVSHDKSLTKKYADQVIEMDDGQIVNVINHSEIEEDDSHLSVLSNGIPNRKAKIPDNFLINHTFHTMKQKKLRTGLCYTMTSLGLTGVGLAFALSSTIADNIKQAYREIVDENSLIVSLKDKNSSIQGQYASSFVEVSNIEEAYPDYVDGVGAAYYCNFENFFVDKNVLALQKDNKYSVIPGYSARHINEFEWLEDIKTTVYPHLLDELEDEEIVLGLNVSALREICFELQIDRTISSLSNYILDHELRVFFDLENDEWEYSDQQLLVVKGFTLETSLKIYHSNHLWNEHMFEEQMRFPTNDSLNMKDAEPWVMKKIYYLKANDNRDKLLNLLIEDKEMDNFIFEIADESIFPWSYYDKAMEERKRILVFNNTVAHIPSWHTEYFMKNDSNLKTPIAGSSGGYLIYPEALMMGFAKTMYFSKSEDQIYEIVDKHTTRNKDSFFNESLPEGVISGNYAKSLQNGVRYDVFSEKSSYVGSVPDGLDEIAVSSYFADQCQIAEVGETVFMTTTKKEIITNTGSVISDYQVVPLKVTAIVNSNKNLIYHHKNWTTLFYQCKVGISAFDLQTNAMSFSLNNPNKIDASIELFKKAFPDYNIINPLSDVNDSVDTVCFYITIVLIVFSFVATLISILLLTICNYLYILESKKEIALARCIGVNKKESKKFLYYHSLIQCLISFAVASIELFFFSLAANFEVGNALSIGFHFSFNPIAFIPMFVLALSIALISSLIMSRRINKINPIDALKQ